MIDLDRAGVPFGCPTSTTRGRIVKLKDLPILVIAVALTATACTGSESVGTTSVTDPVTTTLAPATTQATTTSSATTSTTTTTSAEGPLPEECSAHDLDPEALEAYPPSYEGLPEVVATTRARLIEAAVACDFDTLIELAFDGGEADGGHDHIFSGAVYDFDLFVWSDSEHAHLRQLVLALTMLPYEGYDAWYDGDVKLADAGFSWPPATRLWDGEQSFSLDEVWDDDLIDRAAFVNDMTPEDLINLSNDWEAYPAFSTDIREDGRWWLAGWGD